MKLHWHVGSEGTVHKCSLSANAQFDVAREADSGECESVRSGLTHELKHSRMQECCNADVGTRLSVLLESLSP
jgi:hypothetical protein